MGKKAISKIEECILSIDVGTQSIRSAIVDLKGRIISIVKTPIEPYFSTHPGWAEQDPEYFWKTLGITCRKLLRSMDVPKEAIKAVTLTTQRNTVINLDKKGKPLRPAIVWLDQRKAKREKWPPFPIMLILKIMNLMDAVNYSITESDANWIRQNQPEIWDKTYKFLFLSGFLTYRLTGEYIDSTANQVGFIPFDYKRHRWPKKSHNYWKRIPMNKDILPSLVKPTEILGYITPQASKETGIPQGLQVIASATDKACEALGAGCLTPEIACISYGTTAIIETTSEKYVEVIPFIPPFPSAVPGAYNTEIMIYRGYWMISWFKKEFGWKEEEIAKKKNIASEKLFDEMARDITPGSMGLMLQPYWSPGIRIPGPEAKGAIIGFGDVHTRAHIYRAILEGLAFALREGAIRTELKNRVKIQKLRISGGGSQSDVAMQITSDIFDLPAERPNTYETSTLGAAIDAAVGCEFYSDFQSAVQGMTGIGKVFEPIPSNRDIYKELFERVYLKMYHRLKNLYDSIRDITGYPSKIH
ncbi:MAG: FGGY-family carbohydrate kinase [Spirochaetota bacterium]|nr:FGGY-family carbohydrate kinase [Spirochaetota bacterium]